MQPQELEFDFWEFVSCAKCRLPFTLDNGAQTLPFWLTECGHIICNSHLNPDQTCSQCGTRDVQLAPLQREMEPPMSDWFQPIPQALDNISYTIKFQQDALASQLRYFRSRNQQFRQIYERIKKELSDSKKENEALRHENDHLKLQLYQQGKESYTINANGKRQMTSTHESKISPGSRSIHTPIGPNRLTLHPSQSASDLFHTEQNSRPVSSLSLEQYAYKVRDNEGVTPPTRGFQRFQPQSSQLRPQNSAAPPTNGDAMPSSSRFHVPRLPPASSRNITTGRFGRAPAVMGPPATPQHLPKPIGPYLRPESRQRLDVPSTSSGHHPVVSASTPQRFFPNGIVHSSSVVK